MTMNFLLYIYYGAFYLEKWCADKMMKFSKLSAVTLASIIYFFLPNLKREGQETDIKSLYNSITTRINMGEVHDDTLAHMLMVIFILLIDITVVTKRIIRCPIVDYYISWKTVEPTLGLLIIIAGLIAVLYKKYVEKRLKQNEEIYEYVNEKNACVVYCTIAISSIAVLLFLMSGKSFYSIISIVMD